MESKTLVKICGVKRVEDAINAADFGADFIGMIFAKSDRQISIEYAAELVNAVRKHCGLENKPRLHVIKTSGIENYGNDTKQSSIEWFGKNTVQVENVLGVQSIASQTSVKKCPLMVGVFVNPSLEEVLKVVEETKIDIVQLHGNEDLKMCLDIPVPCVKVFHMKSSEPDSDLLNRLSTPGYHSFVLLDTFVQGENVHGGLGQSFDWNIARKVGQSTGIKVALAGGLTPQNVHSAIEAGNPWAVDVSSGTEVSGAKGVKDKSKIEAFIVNARS